MTHALSLGVDDELLALNRAVGELRRRNLPIASIAVAPGERPGEARLTVLVDTDPATAEMAVRKLDKVSGVRWARHFVVEQGLARELILCRVRTPPGRDAELLDVCARFQATVLETRPEELVIELSGEPSAVRALVDAVQPFGIVELVRSGPVAVARAATGAAAPPVAP